MGKHTITQLKAPWPSGAKVGDVIELDHVPAWAVGKCEPAAEDAEVTLTKASGKLVANVTPAEVLQEVVVGVDVTFDEAMRAVEDAGDAVEVSPRLALEAEAKALGVEFRSNISDEKLAERIAEAKAKQ